MKSALLFPELEVLAKRKVISRAHNVGVDVLLFILQEVFNGVRKSRMLYPVAGPGMHGREAALDFVLALRARINTRDLVADAIVDALVIAGFKMQKPVFLGAAPVAAI